MDNLFPVLYFFLQAKPCLNSMKLFQKLITLFFLIVLVSIVGSLYVGSGLPTPWAKPTEKAYEKLNRSNLKTISELLIPLKKDQAGLSWEVLKNYDFINEIKYELPSNIPFTMYETPQGKLHIIVSGNTKDRMGMLWGLTADGNVIKYFAEDSKE